MLQKMIEYKNIRGEYIEMYFNEDIEKSVFINYDNVLMNDIIDNDKNSLYFIIQYLNNNDIYDIYYIDDDMLLCLMNELNNYIVVDDKVDYINLRTQLLNYMNDNLIPYNINL